MCVQLAVVALKAGQIVRIVLACIETALNFVVQFLLRSSMFKVPPWQCPKLAPCASSGRVVVARGGLALPG